MTLDRSVTEHRINEYITVCECNHRTKFDPEYVGFVIKGVHYLFEKAGIPLDGVYKLADVIDKIVTHKPGSTVSVLINIIFRDYQTTGDLEVNFAEAA